MPEHHQNGFFYQGQGEGEGTSFTLGPEETVLLQTDLQAFESAWVLAKLVGGSASHN